MDDMDGTENKEIPGEQEKRMIDYAVHLAEKQVQNGTASGHVITHYYNYAIQQYNKEWRDSI